MRLTAYAGAVGSLAVALVTVVIAVTLFWSAHRATHSLASAGAEEYPPV